MIQSKCLAVDEWKKENTVIGRILLSHNEDVIVIYENLHEPQGITFREIRERQILNDFIHTWTLRVEIVEA